MVSSVSGAAVWVPGYRDIEERVDQLASFDTTLYVLLDLKVLGITFS